MFIHALNHCVSSFSPKLDDLYPLVVSVQGIENIRNEIEDTMEPLIDPVHGHGR